MFGFSGIVHAEEYTYDDDGRVISVKHDDGSYTKYEYDKNGNIISTVTVKASEIEDGNDTHENSDSKTGGKEESNSKNDSTGNSRGDFSESDKIDKENMPDDSKSVDTPASSKSVNTPEKHQEQNAEGNETANNKEPVGTNMNTGDNAYIVTAIIVAVIALIAIIFILIKKKRR